MKKSYYLPDSDVELSIWLSNFAAKLQQYAAKYGITAAEVADMVAAAAYLAALLNHNNQWREHSVSLTAFKNKLLKGVEAGASIVLPTPPAFALPTTIPAPGIIARITALGNRIKAHLAYTEIDGKNLGLEGAEFVAKSAPSSAPILTISQPGGGLIRIIWKKIKGADAIEIQVDRGQGWEFLAIDTIPDYMDTHTLPAGQTAQWKYRAIYRHHDEQVGDWSDTASIAVVF